MLPAHKFDERIVLKTKQLDALRVPYNRTFFTRIAAFSLSIVRTIFLFGRKSRENGGEEKKFGGRINRRECTLAESDERAKNYNFVR